MPKLWKSFKNKPRRMFFFDYYQPEFTRLHLELEASGYSMGAAIARAAKFWDAVEPGKYPPDRGLELVSEYAVKLEEHLADIIRRHSVAYWLHAYRRIGPHFPGASPATVWIVRRTLEAAVHKYGEQRMCDRIANSSDVPLERILDGALTRHEGLQKLATETFKRPQLVLTHFGLHELAELYDAESLAYEIWGCGATLRVLGKGAPLLVDSSLPHRFKDDRSDELHKLVTNLDRRGHRFFATATGTVFRGPASGDGVVMLPVYNVGNQDADYIAQAFEKLAELELQPDASINFAWIFFDVRQFFLAHQPFADAFESKHGVSLTSVLAVLAGLLFAAVGAMSRDKAKMVQLWQRAYDGPYSSHARILEVASTVTTLGVHVLGAPAKVEDVNVEKAVDFLRSRGAGVNVLLGGPMGMFLTSGSDCTFIDYAWVQSTLYNLFFDVQPKDGNFKGKLLVKCTGFIGEQLV